MNAIDLLDFSFRFTPIRYIDFSSVFLYAHKPEFWWDTILAGIVQIIFACALTVIFIYILPFINTRRYLIKGAGYGLVSWFIIFAIASIYKIPIISGLPWQTATNNAVGSVVYGLVMVEVIRRFYGGKEEWGGQKMMEDRFTQGFIAGGIAGVVQVLLDWLFKVFHFSKVILIDYSSILLYAKKPTFWWDGTLALIAYLAFTCAIGVVFAYMIQYMSSKNYLLKGWFLAIITWFAVFAIGTMYKIPLLNKVEWQDATANFITTSIFGLLMAIALKFLSKDASWKRVHD
jgi:hypothetical protein